MESHHCSAPLNVQRLAPKFNLLILLICWSPIFMIFVQELLQSFLITIPKEITFYLKQFLSYTCAKAAHTRTALLLLHVITHGFQTLNACNFFRNIRYIHLETVHGIVLRFCRSVQYMFAQTFCVAIFDISLFVDFMRLNVCPSSQNWHI